MTQEIRNDLKQCIQAEVKEIFQHISHLIQQAHVGEKSVDYVVLDQKVSDHFNRLAYILRSICENSQLKKNDTNALKKCFDYANTDLAQEYEQWKQQYPHEAQWYEIKLPHFKLAQPLARDNVIRQQQLKTGSLLLSFKKRFNAAWGESIQLYLSNISQTSTSQEQQEAINCLFECLCINLILEQGCIQSERLLAIHDAIFEYDLESGLFPLYATKNDAAYVFCYEMKSKKYGNDYQLDIEGHPTLIQTQQIYFNPIAMICYLRIKEMLNGVYGYALQATSPMQIWQSASHDNVEREDVLFKRLFTHIQQVLPQDPFLTELKRLGFSAFKPIDYVLWQSTSLDVLSTELIKDQLMTSPLRYSDQRLIFEEIPKQTDQIIQNRIAQKLIPIFFLDHHKTENTPLSEALDRPLGLDQTKAWKMSFKQHKNARQLNDDLHDSISRSIQYITRYQQGGGGEYLDYILAVMNLRLCQWLHHLFRYRTTNGKTDLAPSTIEKYYYTVSSDLLLYVLEHEMDLNTATVTQFEEMYQTLFEIKYLEDSEKQKKVASSQQKKQHKTAQVMLGRLKSFHHYLMVNHQAPSVTYFYQQQAGQGLFLKTNLVSPEMFQQMMFALNEFAPHWKLSVQDQTYLKWIYHLAYRLGLRIDEVMGIRLNDLVSAQLRRHPQNKSIYVEEQLTDLSLLIRANYHRNLKNSNATRQFDLRYFLPESEFVAFRHFYQQQIASGYAEASYKKQHRLLFSLSQSSLSANHLSKMTKSLFDVVLGTVEHRYTFHSFRHSAASHFALILRASSFLLRRYFGQGYLAYCFELKKHILPKLKQSKDLSAGCADLWQRLAYLMGHDSIRMTASHYIHVFQWLVADQFYQTDQHYDPSLVKALLQNSHIIKAWNRFRADDPNNTLCAFLKIDLEQGKRKALPNEIQKRTDHRPISAILYQQRLFGAYQDWTSSQEGNADTQAIIQFLTALTQYHFIYKKDRPITRKDIENTWLRFIEWSYQYNISKPIEINKNIRIKDIKRYLSILEHNISLDRDKPLIRFNVISKKDELDYHFFIDFIQKIYPNISNVVYMKVPVLTHDQVKNGKNRAKNYVISHKKVQNKHHFIQELLVNSLFLKLEMLDFDLKRAKTNPNK